MSTKVASNASIRNQVFNAALFLESARIPSFTNLMTDGTPTLGKEGKKASAQSGAGAPIVRVDNLAKEMGDKVTLDIFQQLNMKPVMGDAKLAGKMGSLKYASFDLMIDQGRTGVDSGGRMSRQRTKHDLAKIVHTTLKPYYGRLEDQQCLVHLAGARGYHEADDWILPLESDPDFAKICVNPVTPPTYDRHLYGGDASAIDNIDAADIMNLGVVDNIRLFLDEMAYPLSAVRFEKDMQNDDNPFYVFYITPRQWKDLHDDSSDKDIRMMQAQAMQRSKGFDHSLFRGDVLMWNNILIKKQRRPIRFYAGNNVSVCTNTDNAQTTTLQPSVTVERAILLGAQALANAFGNVEGSGSLPFAYHDEKTDHGNVTEHSLAWMNGKAKIRFKGTDGRVNDYGTIAVDTAVAGI